MNRIVAIFLGIISFILSVIILDFLFAVFLMDGYTTVALFGNFPAPEEGYLESYLGFLTGDTIGWLSYVFMHSAQSFEVLAANIQHGGNVAPGIIPILMEFNPFVEGGIYTGIFKSYLFSALKLIIPMAVVGIVGGLACKTRKQALVNTILVFLVIGIVAVVFNLVHVLLNWVSFSWKFDAVLQLSPLFIEIHELFGKTFFEVYGATLTDGTQYTSQPHSPFVYIISISIMTIVFALINGVIMGILAVGVARKK